MKKRNNKTEINKNRPEICTVIFDLKKERDWNWACWHSNVEIRYISWGVSRLPGFILGNIEPYWVKKLFWTPALYCSSVRLFSWESFEAGCQFQFSFNYKTFKVVSFKTDRVQRMKVFFRDSRGQFKVRPARTLIVVFVVFPLLSAVICISAIIRLPVFGVSMWFYTVHNHVQRSLSNTLLSTLIKILLICFDSKMTAQLTQRNT